jgi:hypothetical protein
LDRPCQALPSLDPVAFIKSKIGFVCHSKVVGGINDLPVEFKCRIISLEKVLWDFGKIGVEADTEKAFFSPD